MILNKYTLKDILLRKDNISLPKCQDTLTEILTLGYSNNANKLQYIIKAIDNNFIPETILLNYQTEIKSIN